MNIFTFLSWVSSISVLLIKQSFYVLFLLYLPSSPWLSFCPCLSLINTHVCTVRMSKQTSVLRDHRLEQLCAFLITLPAEKTVPAVIPGWRADMQWQKRFVHPHQPFPCSLKALESMKSLKSFATIWSRATVWKDGQKWKGSVMDLGVRRSWFQALCLEMPFSVILANAFTNLQLGFSL